MGTRTGAGADYASITRWLTVYLAILSGRKSDEIELSQPLGEFDLDSVDAVELATEFEKAFSHEMDPELFLFGDQTLGELVAKLANALAQLPGTHS